MQDKLCFRLIFDIVVVVHQGEKARLKQSLVSPKPAVGERFKTYLQETRVDYSYFPHWVFNFEHLFPSGITFLLTY